MCIRDRIYIESGLLSSGSASLEAIRRSLIDFKESGKFVVAYADNFTQGNYFLCSVADKVFLNPQGILELTGLASQTLFYKGLMDKVGIEMQIFKVGTYKGAVEPFMLDKLSLSLIHILLIRMGRTLLRKVPIGRRSHRGKEKKVSSSGFPKFRNRGITRSMPPINLFRTAQSRHCIPSIMPEGKPQSPSIKQWGVGLGSIWETSNSRHMNKPMRESY